MLVKVCFLLTSVIIATSAPYYEVPDAKVEALKPRGLRVSIPDEPGIKLFAFHGNINKDFDGLEAGEMAKDVIKPKNGRWVFQDDRVRLKAGDVVYYWLHVIYEDLGYNKLDQKFTVTEFVDAGGQIVKPDTSAPQPVPQPAPQPPLPQVPPQVCEQTKTIVNGRQACKGQLIFEEDFNNLDHSKWEHDVRIADTPDSEFVVYTDDSANSFVQNGILHVKPTLTSDKKNGRNIGRSTLCTGIQGSADCSKEAQTFNIIPPILSSRIRTRNHFSFCYGRVEIRAKLPAGDWIFPEIWLEPKDNWYGREYLSGRIQLALTRGNKELQLKDQPRKHIGQRLLEAGCSLGVDDKVTSLQKSWEKSGSIWCDNFHIYTLEWAPGDLSFRVDGQIIGVISPPPGGFYNLPFFSKTRDVPWARGSKLAPFDKEFYLTLGLGVGGIRVFPDNCTTGLPQGGLHPKPWVNTEPKVGIYIYIYIYIYINYRYFISQTAMLQFWRDKDNWQQTWSEDNSHLQVDYVKKELTMMPKASKSKAFKKGYKYE
ncbi:hypothetical protein L9F63_007202, partial [Diploptera punctata]